MDNPLFNDLSTINNEDELLLLIEDVIKSLGGSGFLFSYAINGWLPSGEPGEIQRWVSKGIDKKLLKTWLAPVDDTSVKVNDFSLRFDPVRRFMVRQTIPHQFFLSDIVKGKNNQYTLIQKRWFKSLIKNNVVSIIATPVQLPPSEYWSLSFFSSDSEYKLAPTEQANLMLFTHKLTHYCIDMLHWREEGSKHALVKLREREKDCLYWSGQGKTAADAAKILGLKTETVRKYIKNAMKRLSASTKAQAVVKAIELGLLDLSIPRK